MISKAPFVDRPWKILSIYLVGPLSRFTSACIFILSVTDIFNEYILLVSLRSATSVKIAQIFEEYVIRLYGAPNREIMDNMS